jgi:hypothetical protein
MSVGFFSGFCHSDFVNELSYPLPSLISDLSAKFEAIVTELQKKSRFAYELPPNAKDYHYVFIGGLWSNYSQPFFKTASERLSALGLSNARVHALSLFTSRFPLI